MKIVNISIPAHARTDFQIYWSLPWEKLNIPEKNICVYISLHNTEIFKLY